MGQQIMTTVNNGATTMATVEVLQFGEIHASSRVKFVLIIADMLAVLHFTLSKVTTTLPTDSTMDLLSIVFTEELCCCIPCG